MTLFTLPFSMTLCLRALATRTRTFATGSEERLSRLGKRCWPNCSMGMQSSSTIACRWYQVGREEKHTHTHKKSLRRLRQQVLKTAGETDRREWRGLL